MTFKQAIINFYSRGLEFSGRSSRAEYWLAVLYEFILFLILDLFIPVLGLIFAIVHIIPSLSITIRRLHDSNKSGFFILLGLIPLVGWLIMLILTLLPGDPQRNRFGYPQI